MTLNASSSPQPDAIFIGAGINALTSALLLARAGWRVLVLERNEAPGGAVRTAGLTLPGLRPLRHSTGPGGQLLGLEAVHEIGHRIVKDRFGIRVHGPGFGAARRVSSCG